MRESRFGIMSIGQRQQHLIDVNRGKGELTKSMTMEYQWNINFGMRDEWYYLE